MNEAHLRIVMLLFTFLLWGQLVDLYRIQMKEEMMPYYVHDSVFWKKYRPWCFAVEVFVLGITVFPGLGDRLSRHFALFMVFRLYLVFRVLRNRSRLYQLRFLILRDSTLRSLGTVHVSWALVFKVTFLDSPWTTVTVMMLTAIFTYSFGIYCYERQPNDTDPVWSIRDALWLVFNTSTTLGLGDLTPRTSGGRVVVALSVVTGLVIESLLVYVVLSSLSMRANESHARNIMWLSIYTQRQREAAATLIQLEWRAFAARERARRDRDSTGDRDQGPTGANAEQLVNLAFDVSELKAKLKRYRRELVFIRMQTSRLLSGASIEQSVDSFFSLADATDAGAVSRKDPTHGGADRPAAGHSACCARSARECVFFFFFLFFFFFFFSLPLIMNRIVSPPKTYPCLPSTLVNRNRDLRQRLNALEELVATSFHRTAQQNREIMIAVTGRDPAASLESESLSANTYDGGRHSQYPGFSMSSSSTASSSASSSSSSDGSEERETETWTWTNARSRRF
jgi:hypothetical protein